MAGILFGNLGAVLQEVGDLPAARAHFDRALVVLGRSAERTSQQVGAITRLGSMLLERKLVSEARAICQQALAFSEALPDDDRDPQTMMLLFHTYGAVLLALGEVREARIILEKAVAIHDRMRGVDPFQTARLLNGLGQALGSLGDLDLARTALQRAAAAYDAAQPRYGADKEIASAHYELGAVLLRRGDLVGARDHLERASSLEAASYGTDHPTVATTLLHLNASWGFMLHG